MNRLEKKIEQIFTKKTSSIGFGNSSGKKIEKKILLFIEADSIIDHYISINCSCILPFSAADASIENHSLFKRGPPKDFCDDSEICFMTSCKRFTSVSPVQLKALEKNNTAVISDSVLLLIFDKESFNPKALS